MANIKISAMPVLATMNDTALIPVVDGSSNKRITGLVAKTYTSASPTLTGTPSSTGIFTINYVGNTESSLVIAGSNTLGGAGYHDFLVVKNGAVGATNTNKSFRLNSTGSLEILNSAYSTTILELSDGGQLTVRGSAVLNLDNASPSITTTGSAASVFNTNALTGNLFGAATTIGIGASTGTITLGNPTITGTNATTFNMNGTNPSIVTSSTGTASVFNTNALTVNAFNAATTVTLVNSATTLGIGNTATAAQTVNMFTASTGSSTYNFATGATTSGSTKSINIGTAGVSGSTTNIIIGSTVSGATNNLTFGGGVADATATSTAKSVGYLGMPQQSKSSAYTTVIGDSGKHIYVTATATITIDSNANVAYPIGTTITFIAGSGATATIAITSDTMYLGGSGTTGSRTLAPFGMATAVKVASTTWFINGTGLT
jgi:hypothetical protein